MFCGSASDQRTSEASALELTAWCEDGWGRLYNTCPPQTDCRYWWSAGREPARRKKTVTEVTVVWWSIAGSNRWPPACKAGALPAELMPQINALFWHATAVCLVGLNGLEPTTSPLSGVRSNHLSYRPNKLSAHRFVSRLIILTQENTFANTFLKISSKFFIFFIFND